MSAEVESDPSAEPCFTAQIQFVEEELKDALPPDHELQLEPISISTQSSDMDDIITSNVGRHDTVGNTTSFKQGDLSCRIVIGLLMTLSKTRR